MFIPWRTDAPVYHRPWATIGLIAANVLVFFGFELHADADTIDDWILAFGDGLHPLQWISGGFMHAGFMHLAGNMVFLWTFGLVVEGKIGWWRFLAAYLGIGVAQSALLQICMLGARPSGALGASSMITGIMAMAAIWAPRNQVDCVLWLAIRPVSFELPMLGVIGFFIGWDVLESVLRGFAMSTATLHASGALMGAPIGLLMVRRRWVDCEGWDLFTIWTHGRPMTARDLAEERRHAEMKEALAAGRLPSPRPPPAARSAAPAPADPRAERSAAEARIRDRLRGKDGAGAAAALAEAQRACGRWDLPADLLQGLARHHLERREWSEAVALLDEQLRRFPGEAGAAAARLNLAQVHLVGRDRPSKALETLAPLQPEALNDRQRELLAKLKAGAEAKIAAGALEIDD